MSEKPQLASHTDDLTSSPLSPEELDYWTELYSAEESDQQQTDREDFLVFRLGDERFAMAMSDLDEVATLTTGAALPNVNPMILGLTNLRGEVVMLLDTARVLNAKTNPKLGASNRTLVIKDREGRRTGLIVDALEGVLPLETGQYSIAVPDSGAELPLRRIAAAEHQDSNLFLVDVSPLRDATLNHF